MRHDKKTKGEDMTSAALLEQLVYIDNFMNNNSGSSGSETTPNIDLDGQLSLDLAAFADDAFIFPDEDKPHGQDTHFTELDIMPRGSSSDSMLQVGAEIDSRSVPKDIAAEDGEGGINALFNQLDVSSLPRYPVPPGAKSSLELAGLSHNQIDLLSALVAQHQSNIRKSSVSNEHPAQQHDITQEVDSVETQSTQHVPFRRTTPLPQTPLFSSSVSSTPKQSFSSSIASSPSSVRNGQQDDNISFNELDKRRRNIAASARFRIKKKLKEKQMENHIQHLKESVQTFEAKIDQLEMENNLLRNLIIERGSQKSEDELKRLKEKARSS